MEPRFCISASDVQAAAARIQQHVHRTPVFTSATINALAGCEVFFKAEALQKSGSFKARGATNAVWCLTPEEAACGVVTHSSGNHGAALAMAAATRGAPCTVVMPTNAPTCKRVAVAAYGAKIVDCEPTQAAREAAAASVVEATGGVFIHPSEDPRVIAGQGTLAVELLEQVPELDALIVPVGGGGMLSGVAVATKAASPDVRIFAAEPAGAADAAASKASGVHVKAHPSPPATLADGLKTCLGPNTFPIVCSPAVEEVLTVSEEALVAAMRLVFERLKLVIEPSAAVGVAALLSDRFAAVRTGTAGPAATPDGARGSRPITRVGVVLCGGNVDLSALPFAL